MCGELAGLEAAESALVVPVPFVGCEAVVGVGRRTAGEGVTESCSRQARVQERALDLQHCSIPLGFGGVQFAERDESRDAGYQSVAAGAAPEHGSATDRRIS